MPKEHVLSTMQPMHFFINDKEVVFPGDAWVVKPLNGIEAMRCQGWDISHWCEDLSPYTVNSDSQLRRLAGNAFNAFPFAALISCIVASQGLYLDNVVLSGGLFALRVQALAMMQ